SLQSGTAIASIPSSLSVEEQFYLLWPLAFSLGVRSAKRSCWGIMFVSPIIRFFLKHHGYAQYAHLAPAIVDSLAAGCLLAFYENRVRAFGRKYFSMQARSCGLVCSVIPSTYGNSRS
ncbi:MAG: hypothetical protein QOJ51_4220, partial [Acidobacteriaceae bacterium]|nr:hypothetical protein [Acidobacteriaceae bacterium]